MRNGTDRLRALNAPQRVRVELDEQRRPRVVKREAGNEKRVESFGENWRMDDEWWRQPIVRRYVEVVLEGGGRVVLTPPLVVHAPILDRKSTRLNSSHITISYAVFCLKKKKTE